MRGTTLSTLLLKRNWYCFCSVAINENDQIIQQIITIQNDPKNAKGTNKIFDKNVTLFGKYVWFSQLLSPLSQNDVHEQLNNTIKPLKVAYTHSQMRHNLQTPSIHIHKTHNCLSSGYTAKQQRWKMRFQQHKPSSHHIISSSEITIHYLMFCHVLLKTIHYFISNTNLCDIKVTWGTRNSKEIML